MDKIKAVHCIVVNFFILFSLCLVFAAPSKASIVQSIISPSSSNLSKGINVAQPILTSNKQNRLKQSGASYSRINFAWNGKATNFFTNWKYLDTKVENNTNAGIPTVAVLMKNPGGHFPVGEHEKDFISWVKTAVKRYPEIAVWQIWNEPNLRKGDTDGEGYGNFVARVMDAVHETRKSARTIPGGLAVNKRLPAFLKSMNKSDLFTSSRTNVLAIHPYEATVQEMAQSIKDTRKTLKKLGLKKLKLWLTEFGWGSGGGAFGKGEAVSQAKTLAEGYAAIEEMAGSYKIETAFWYDFEDNPQDKGINDFSNHGLINQTGLPKGAYLVFQQLNSAAPLPIVDSDVGKEGTLGDLLGLF